MPGKQGPNTYKGYESPNTSGWPEEIRTEVRHVYGAYRSKHPGEDPRIKARGSRIAWSAARRKYPELYRQHSQQVKRGTRQEHKEHPEFSVSTARQIASDHIRSDPTSYTIKEPRKRNSKPSGKHGKDDKSFRKKIDLQAARIAAMEE